MGANEPPGCGQFGSQGHGWQDLCRRPNIAGFHGFREEDFLRYFYHYKSMRAYNDPLGHGQFWHKGREWQDLCRGLL